MHRSMLPRAAWRCWRSRPGTNPTAHPARLLGGNGKNRTHSLALLHMRIEGGVRLSRHSRIELKIKLITLNPRWVLAPLAATPGAVGAREDRYGMGISFDCPVHVGLKSSLQSGHRVTIYFANPMDGRSPACGVPLWQRTGSSFAELTVSPSGDAHAQCWHGIIKNGEIPDPPK